MHFGNHLLRLSSIRFKTIPDIPEYLVSGIRRASESRTVRQKGVSLFKWMMSKPQETTEELSSTLIGWAIGNRTRVVDENIDSKEEKLDEDKEKLAKPHFSKHNNNKPTKEESTPYIYGPSETISYNHFFSTQNYTISQTVLEHIALLRSNFHPKRVLDFGCGIGVGGLSSLSVFHTVTSPVREICFVDRSQSMIDSCKILCETYNESYPKNSVEFNHFLKLSHVIDRERIQASKLPHYQRFNLIICNYCISVII